MSSTAEKSNLQGWGVVATSFFALALVFSARSSVGVLMPTWELELGWARTLTSSGGSVVLAVMGVVSPLAGNLIDRYGPRWVFAGGLAVLGVAIIATSLISEEWQFLILFGLVGGFGYGALSVPLVSAAVAGYFERGRGLVTSIAISGSTGGQLPLLPLLAVLVTGIGWRDTYALLGGVLLLLAPVTLVLIRRRSASTRTADSGNHGARTLGAKLRFLFRDRTFLLLLGTFVLCGFTTAGVADVHFVPYAVASGYTLVDSTAAYGVHGLFNMLGLLLAGWLSDHINRPRLLAAIYFVRAWSFVLLLFIGYDVTLMFVFTAVFGLLNFSVLPIIASIVASHIGVRIMGLTMGLLFGGHSLGAAVGALAGGYVYDLTGDYFWLWIVSGVLAFVAAVFSFLVHEVDRDRRTAVPATAIA